MEFLNLSLKLPYRIDFEGLASKLQQHNPEPLCVINGAELVLKRYLNINLNTLTLENIKKNQLGFMEYSYRGSDDAVYCFFTPLAEEVKGGKKPDMILPEKSSVESYEDTRYF